MKPYRILFLLLGMSACSNQALYNDLITYQREKCLTRQPFDREVCQEQDAIDMTYEEYRREREKLLDLD